MGKDVEHVAILKKRKREKKIEITPLKLHGTS
jgi:hypothetical protein